MKQFLSIFLTILCTNLVAHLGMLSAAERETWEYNGKIYQKYFVPDVNASFFIDDIPDGIKDHLRRGIYWEGGIGNLIKSYVKENSIAIDVGAHIGIHTIVMSRKVGPYGAVIAFEPQNKMYAELLKNLETNQCSNVIPIRKALGDVPQFIQLNPREILNEGGTAIGEGGDDAELIRLDDLQLSNVSFIKIDVECYERHVFEGARRTILQSKPVIIFELMAGKDYLTCDDATKREFEEFFAYVESFGYQVSLIFGADYLAIPL